MDYIFLVVAAALYSLMFLTNRGYQRSNGTGISAGLSFAMYTSMVGLPIFLVISAVGMISGWSPLADLKLEFSWFSLLMALLNSGVLIGYSIFSIKALAVANLSLFSIFAMLGGMLLPSLYGLIFSNEPVTAGKIACYVLIAVALFLTFEKGGKNSKKSMLYCFGVFVLNGLSGVVTSIHSEEIFSDIAVSSGSFMIMNRAGNIVVCLILLLAICKKIPKMKLSDLGNVAGNGACAGMGNLLQLMALATLDSSVLFPIVTGGTMLFSMLVSIMIKEKPSVKTIIASILAAASTVLMMF